MFSHRAFLHEAEMKGANIPLKIERWDGAGTLKQLRLTIGPDFKQQILEGWVVQGDQIYAMKSTKGGLEFGDSAKQSLAAFISGSGSPPVEVVLNRRQGNEVISVEDQFRKYARPLIAWSLATEDFTQPMTPTPAANSWAQLFLFARSPEGFGITGSELGHEIGYVLYHLNLFKPGTAEGI
jgi:hypothetical protein